MHDDEDEEDMQREAAALVARMRETGDYTYDTPEIRVLQLELALHRLDKGSDDPSLAQARVAVMADRVTLDALEGGPSVPRQVKEDRLKELALRNILRVLAGAPEFSWAPEPDRQHLKALFEAQMQRALTEEGIRQTLKPIDLRDVAAIPGFAGDDES